MSNSNVSSICIINCLYVVNEPLEVNSSPGVYVHMLPNGTRQLSIFRSDEGVRVIHEQNNFAIDIPGSFSSRENSCDAS